MQNAIHPRYEQLLWPHCLVQHYATRLLSLPASPTYIAMEAGHDIHANVT